MTLEELADRIDSRFETLGAKIDALNTTVAVHTTTLSTHDREMRSNKDEHTQMNSRIDKIDKWMWFTLGAGGAAGAGLAKLFM